MLKLVSTRVFDPLKPATQFEVCELDQTIGKISARLDSIKKQLNQIETEISRMDTGETESLAPNRHPDLLEHFRLARYELDVLFDLLNSVGENSCLATRSASNDIWLTKMCGSIFMLTELLEAKIQLLMVRL